MVWFYGEIADVILQSPRSNRILLFLLFCFSSVLHAQTDLNSFIASQMQTAKIPWMAVLIEKGNAVKLAQGYGYADIEKRKPFTIDTTVMVASVSKTFVGTAVMQLWEQKRLKLNDDVNKYLPFKVRNPLHPGTPITVRELLCHVSSIRDRYSVWDPLYYQGDSPIPLGDFLRKYLVPGGQYFRPENYYQFAPKTRYQYSNIGAALAAYVVESVSKINFSEYCKQNIFRPLKMNQTAWFLRDLDLSRLATPYDYDFARNAFVPLPQFGYPDYPNGQLRTSARQLLRFLIAHIKYGQNGTVRILQQRTVQEMRKIQFPSLDNSQGISFYYYYASDGDVWLGHSGATDGVRSEMWFRVSDGTGIIILCNRWLYTSTEEQAWNNIWFRLVEEANRL